MIYNVRGTNGSGKTYVVKRLVRKLGISEDLLTTNGKKVLGHYLGNQKKIFVVGRYTEGLDTGGCDNISSVDDVRDIVLGAHERGLDVIFEGIIVTSVCGRWLQMAEKIGPKNFVACFLSTTLEECHVRIERRRSGKNLPPVKEAGWVRIATKHRACIVQRPRFLALGCPVIYGSSRAVAKELEKRVIR